MMLSFNLVKMTSPPGCLIKMGSPMEGEWLANAARPALPQARVSPAPRSKVLISKWVFECLDTALTLTPSGKDLLFCSVLPIFSNGNELMLFVFMIK